MKTHAWICLALLAVLPGCAVTKTRRPAPNVILNLHRDDLAKSSLLVFAFAEAPGAEGKGAAAAMECQQLLLHGRLFRVVAQDVTTPWSRLGVSEEARLRTALAEGQRQGYDYVAAGEITAWVYGGSGAARLGVKLRIIDTRSRVTILFVAHRLRGDPRDRSFPLDTRLSEPAPLLDGLLTRALNDILALLR